MRGEAFAAVQETVVVRDKRKVVFKPRKRPPAWAWGVEREPAPLPDPSEVVFRGPRGRLLSKTELARVRAIYEVEKKYEKALKEEKEYLAKRFPITTERTMELQNMLLRLKNKMTDVNLDFYAHTAMDIAGHAMHGKVELHGITRAEVDQTIAKEQVNDLVMAIVEQLRRQKIRRGLMVQLSFVPQEAVYLAYGRDGDLMTTAWARVDKSSEIEAFVPSAQRMAEAMIRNGWDITSMRVSVFYDQTVSGGGRAVRDGTRKKR